MKRSPATPRLCNDCKHYRPLVAGWWIFKIKYDQLAKCNQTTEPVHGEPAEFCEFKRKGAGACGPDGKLWESA